MVLPFNSCSSLITNNKNTGSNLLRKRRKQRVIPYKGKWQQTFNEQQAMESLKKAATLTQPPSLLLSTLINSFAIYDCDPTPSAYSFLIKTLTQHSHFDHLPPVLNRIQNLEKFDPPEELFVYLIKSYGYANRIDDAVDLFENIPSFRCTPSAVSLNALLSLLCRRKEGLERVHHVLIKSQVMNIRLEESSFWILISALCKIKKVGYAVEILNLMYESGYEPDLRFYSFILSSMCKIRGVSFVEVLGFFEEMREKGFSITGMDYANVIGFLVKVGKDIDALRLLGLMKVGGIKPDVVVYNSVLDGAIKAGDFGKAEELFDEMLVLGVVPNVHTYNVYLKGLCLQDKFEEGFKLIVCMEELGCKPEVSSYNTLMQGLCDVGKVRRVREEVLRKIRLKGIQWNLHTYSILIGGLMSEGEGVEACKLFEDMLSKGFVPMSLTCDEMICGLCKLGLISEALRVVEQMIERGITPGVNAWEALLSVSDLSLEETTSLDLALK